MSSKTAAAAAKSVVDRVRAEGRTSLTELSEIERNEAIDRSHSPSGGLTRITLAGWGVPWPPPRGWRENIVINGIYVEESRRDTPTDLFDKLADRYPEEARAWAIAHVRSLVS
jgi:hypothetical protein